jgi:hypothetical protein
LPIIYYVQELPKEFWVEGFATSTAVRDVELVLESVTTPPCEDKVRLTVCSLDLDINTDDHPRQAGVPLVSATGDIDEADDGKEEDPGGYLWVNDDNDHRTANDATLDWEDSSGYPNDDDLEPIRYAISPVDWSAGCSVEVVIGFPPNQVRIWQRNKYSEVTAGSYNSWADLDADQDGVLYLEGLTPGSGTITLRLKHGATVLAEDTIKATVYGVASVEWVSYTAAGIQTVVGPDPGPAPTGQTRDGLRVFPDKTSPTDTTEHDKPRVITTLTPAIPAGSGWHLPLSATVFDVDHYSSVTSFDDVSSSRDREGHNNGCEPNDNRTGYGNGEDPNADNQCRFGQANDAPNIGIEVLDVPEDTVAFSISMADAAWWYECIGGTGQGTAILHITRHVPCNNWRVAVGCAGSLSSRSFRINNDSNGVPGPWQNDGVTLEYINDTPLAVGGGAGTASRSTQTLTVWRKLYLEEDHMGAVNFKEGPLNAWSLQDNDVTGGAGTATLTTDLDASVQDQWQGGMAQFWDMGILNDDLLGFGTITHDAAGAGVTVSFSAAAPVLTDYIYISDDDVFNFIVVGRTATGTANVSPGAPDTTLFNDRGMFPAACIAVDTTSLDAYDTTAVPFRLNIPDADSDNAVIASKGLRGGVDFWVATACISYQADVEASLDPDPPAPGWSCTRGRSCPYWGAAPAARGGFLVFVESTRDWVAHGNAGTPVPGDSFDLRNRRTIVHECGHVLGGRHADTGLMTGGTGTDPASGPFSGTSLRRFMLLRDQGPGEP